MEFRNVNEMLICKMPQETGLTEEQLNKIVGHTANTMVSRSLETIRKNTIRGKKAEIAIEKYINSQFHNQLCYLSYDDIRNDDFEYHAPFDGLIFKPDLKREKVDFFIDEIRKQVNASKPYGLINSELRNQMVDSGVFTFEIKSSELTDRDAGNEYKLSDYDGVKNLNFRTEDDYKAITHNILKKWDFFVFPHFIRHIDNTEKINSIYDYVEYVRKSRQEFSSYSSFEEAIGPIIRSELDNMSEIHTRIYFDPKTDELYIPGYIHKTWFFVGVPKITLMPGNVSQTTLYYTRSIEHYRQSFTILGTSDFIWNYNRKTVYDKLYSAPSDEFTCPRCGEVIGHGQYGYYCKSKDKCGMSISRYYGSSMEDKDVKNLLEGKKTIISKEGRNTTLIPDIKLNRYNGKLSYVWKNI